MGFKEYLLKRLLLIVPILLGVSVISFGMVHLLPGGPVEAALGTRANPELVSQLRAEHGLDRPIWVQYVDWLTDVLQGDFGTTIGTDRDVTQLIHATLPPTIWLAVSGAVVSVVIGIPAGIVSAVNQYSGKDYLATFGAFAGLSVPNFFLGLLLILVFGLYLQWFPTGGFVSPLQDPVEGLRSLVLPAIILAIALVAVLGQSLLNIMIAIGVVYTPIFARVTRSGVLSVREETYVTAARAIGDSDTGIIVRDVLPNAVAPIIVQATVSLAFAILAESALSFLGLGADLSQPSWGRMLSNSRNFMETAPWTVVFPGLAIMITILGFNFLGDGLRDTLDPRQDTEAGGGL
jgi:ABC-type dipeptide/oligopeptide/nickel transport system permease component